MIKHITYDSFEWINNKEKSCDCAIGILETIQNSKKDENRLFLLDEIKNVQTCIDKMEKVILSEMSCNYNQCLEKLENNGIILYLSNSGQDVRYLIKGLEHICDSRCKGWTLIGAGTLNEIGLKCKLVRLQGQFNNKEFEEKISDMLKEIVTDKGISWQIESYLLSQEKHSTSAMVYVYFIWK